MLDQQSKEMREQFEALEQMKVFEQDFTNKVDEPQTEVEKLNRHGRISLLTRLLTRLQAVPSTKNLNAPRRLVSSAHKLA